MKKTTIIFGLLLGLILVPFLSNVAYTGFGLGLPSVIKERVKELDKQAQNIAGTAAKGAAIALKTISVKDCNGALISGTTGADGKFSINVTGLTFPMLLEVADGATTYFSIANASGICNIHPFTDLIIRNWYKVKGTDVETAFAGPGAIPHSPTVTEINTIERVVRQILGTYLKGADINPVDFHLITTPFDVDKAGFDLVLENLDVTYSNNQVAVTPDGGGDQAIIQVSETTDLSTLTPPPPTVPDTSAPSQPSALTATRINSSQVVLSWSASSDNIGVAGYRIYRGGTQIGIIDQTFYIDGKAPATSACYRVSAYDAAGNSSSQSAEFCATPGTVDTIAPSAPFLTATAISSSQIDLSWTASTDNVALAGYRVMVGGVAIAAVPATQTTYSHKDLEAKTQYSYTVVAFDTSGNATPSNIVSTVTQGDDITPPSAPANLATTAVSSSQIDLSWTASTDNIGVAGYRIYSAEGVEIGTSTSTSYSHTGLTVAKQYCYYVKAYDVAGNLSVASTTKCTTTQYTANGTYTLNSTTKVLTLNITSSDFVCKGPGVGTETKTGVTITATTILLPRNICVVRENVTIA
ncbi:MAG: fibronectin type III domain-containing protein, partial [bacterium]|nr:fibronectin type III domain-containing protein [bacterium]